MAEWQEAMTADEFLDWLAYYQVEPFGEFRADLRAGIITSNLMNLHLKKGAKPLQPSDFMPDFTPQELKRLSPDQMIDFVKGFGK